MVNFTFIFPLLKGSCHGNQLVFGPNGRNWPIPHPFAALEFENVLEDRNADGRVNSGDDSAISAKDMVGFRLETPDFTG